MQIRTFAQLIDMLAAQKSNLASYFTQCNATAADVTAITNELNNLTAMDAFAGLSDDYTKNNFKIKQALFNGEIGTPISPFPPALVPPTLVAAVAGSKRLSEIRNRRFKAGPGYTEQIGMALHIAGDTAVPIPQPPTIDVFPAETGMVFSVVVTGRTGSDQWELLVRPVGGGAWTSMGSRTTKSGDFTYNPGATAGDGPIQLEVRVQLKKNDANYGPPSAIHQVTVNP